MAADGSMKRPGHEYSDFSLSDNVKAHFGDNYAAPERPETPPRPFSNVPFPRDPDFVERGSLFDQLNGRLSHPGARVALAGLGGVGKSQFAIERCYRLREQSPETWVLWIHASNAARFDESVRDTVEQLKIPGRKDAAANMLQLLRSWLWDESKGPWSIVLDNADDVDFLLQPPATIAGGQAESSTRASRQNLFRHFPTCSHGSMLITSRSRTSALRLVEHRDVVTVPPMDIEDAVALLNKKLEDFSTGEPRVPDQPDEIRKLATALEFMPLALTQAAAFIVQKRPRCSVDWYLGRLQDMDELEFDLLEHDTGDLRRDAEAKHSILLTWQISFDHLNRTRPSAANMLSLMSFFDRQAIPESLLKGIESTSDKIETAKLSSVHLKVQLDDGKWSRRKSKPKEWKASFRGRQEMALPIKNEFQASCTTQHEAKNRAEIKFEQDLEVLQGYNFVSVTVDSTSFTMHRLVQLATQKWLAHQDQLEERKAVFVKHLQAVFPSGVFGTWSQCEPLYPHVKAALRQKPKAHETLKIWALLLHRGGLYATERGQFREAEELISQAIGTETIVLGAEDGNTLASMGCLARVFQHQGRFQEAEQVGIEVVEVSKRVLGSKHPDTLISMHNLGLTFFEQRRWVEAEALLVKVVEARKKISGPEQPRTLASMGNLAVIYLEQGRLKEAKELQVQIRKTRQKILGAEHPHTLTSMSNLALIYWEQERWKEAEELAVQALEAEKKVLGVRHPETLTSMEYLAWIWKDQGRYQDAFRLMSESVALSTQVLGADHPRTIDRNGWVEEWGKALQVNEDEETTGEQRAVSLNEALRCAKSLNSRLVRSQR